MDVFLGSVLRYDRNMMCSEDSMDVFLWSVLRYD